MPQRIQSGGTCSREPFEASIFEVRCAVRRSHQRECGRQGSSAFDPHDDLTHRAQVTRTIAHAHTQQRFARGKLPRAVHQCAELYARVGANKAKRPVVEQYAGICQGTTARLVGAVAEPARQVVYHVHVVESRRIHAGNTASRWQPVIAYIAAAITQGATGNHLQIREISQIRLVRGNSYCAPRGPWLGFHHDGEACTQGACVNGHARRCELCGFYQGAVRTRDSEECDDRCTIDSAGRWRGRRRARRRWRSGGSSRRRGSSRLPRRASGGSPRAVRLR